MADAPALGDRYHATRGGGAWRGDRRLRGLRRRRASARRSSRTPASRSGSAAAANDALLRVAARARGTRGLSDAWAHLLIAQGSVDALLEHEPCFAWDWTATGVIVEEAGGRLTTLAGDPPSPGADLLVTNGALHDEVLGVLAEAPVSWETA